MLTPLFRGQRCVDTPVFRKHQSKRVAGKFQNRTILLGSLVSDRELAKHLKHSYRQEKNFISHLYMHADQDLTSFLCCFCIDEFKLDSLLEKLSHSKGLIWICFLILNQVGSTHGIIGNIIQMITCAKRLILNINDVNEKNSVISSRLNSLELPLFQISTVRPRPCLCGSSCESWSS